METSYLKLTQGSRLNNYMGLKMLGDFKYKFGKNYLYLDIPVHWALNAEGEGTQEVKRNQHVLIQAAATVNVKGQSFIEVEPNPALAEYGQVQGLFRVHPDSGEQNLEFWFTARRDLDLTKLDFAVRLYMPS